MQITIIKSKHIPLSIIDHTHISSALHTSCTSWLSWFHILSHESDTLWQYRRVTIGESFDRCTSRLTSHCSRKDTILWVPCLRKYKKLPCVLRRIDIPHEKGRFRSNRAYLSVSFWWDRSLFRYLGWPWFWYVNDSNFSYIYVFVS